MRSNQPTPLIALVFAVLISSTLISSHSSETGMNDIAPPGGEESSITIKTTYFEVKGSESTPVSFNASDVFGPHQESDFYRWDVDSDNVWETEWVPLRNSSTLGLTITRVK